MAEKTKDTNCCFKSILKSIESLDMQISRIKNQLTELKAIVREEENRNGEVGMESIND